MYFFSDWLQQYMTQDPDNLEFSKHTDVHRFTDDEKELDGLVKAQYLRL
jgi:hypothetical protein